LSKEITQYTQRFTYQSLHELKVDVMTQSCEKRHIKLQYSKAHKYTESTSNLVEAEQSS